MIKYDFLSVFSEYTRLKNMVSYFHENHQNKGKNLQQSLVEILFALFIGFKAKYQFSNHLPHGTLNFLLVLVYESVLTHFLTLLIPHKHTHTHTYMEKHTIHVPKFTFSYFIVCIQCIQCRMNPLSYYSGLKLIAISILYSDTLYQKEEIHNQ